MMDKTFDPKTVEGRMLAVWSEADAFKAGRPDRKAAEPFAIVIPPPNVTGALHMGHALNATLQDILARFERMRGKDVLWQPGTDHAGIATQTVVERQLMERQEPGRREMGREKFLERVWAWKTASGGAIVEQLQRIGASCDWSRERFTMDEGLSRAVVKVFVQLFREGLIYKDKRLVNWDPALLTAVSDLEVVQVETKGHLWHFNYPVVDDAGVETGEFITVATTRPETMLGDAAVAVNPSDARYLHLQGKSVRLPLVGRLIPIVADDYSDPEKGTGAVKITPAHDFNDFEVGRRHGLPLINIFDAEARLLLNGNEAFAAGAEPIAELAALNGLDRTAARARIVELMEERGLLAAVEPHPHMVPHGDRSGSAIEPWLTDQWYVNAKVLAQPALEAIRSGKAQFIPKNWEKTYFDWLENIEPWCVSRQLWWGHQIPAWYGPDGAIFVAADEAEASEAARAHYGAPTPLQRDPDVLDTWFSSALWPFSTLGWPDDASELKRYYPTSVLITGFDIIFFWVARMMMMGLHFMGEVPFRDIYLHALVRDQKGAKMSKSKGNVIDPLELIDQYGADSLRFTLAAMAAQGRDVKLATQRVEGYRNFATKIWNAARFAEINGCVRVKGFDPKSVKIALNAWIIGEAAKAVGEVTAAIKTYRFNDAANAAYRFVWNIFCDWHLELAKPLLQGPDGAAKDETRAATAFVFDEILKLLHPFMPFLTEELWGVKATDELPRETVLALAPWPDLAELENAAAEAELGWVVELVSEVRSVRSEMNAPAGALIPLVVIGAPAEVEVRAKNWDETLRRLARLSEISFAKEAPDQSAQFIVRGVAAALPLSGVIDFAAEKARLAKEIGKCEAEAKKIDAKLGNADFVARAPEEVVEENRERLEEARARAEKLGAALKRLG
ncbi:valyl-tRNA synthetase [Methylocella silvestris BL2]|uniref:Valine--tRNA ligase n=1 Tax=Methylocella silvestris (strain DSM 15510 / CIP 108128 / LMG 27833 / NCIMB 13906 / BL2) TaxID=395965 RepID=B8EK95_METSB|nr:valine--tRNA ligase [Methylocella silvestris]ACK50635.1 valyl-tRNA synthetase [Methylocella silvestris BL2]